MYGSNFCSRTRRPRCSSNMPIDAQVRPLPRELTTPPVTKICLVCLKGGVMSASSPPVPLFVNAVCAAFQKVTILDPGPVGRTRTGRRGSGRVGVPLPPVFLDELFVVIVGVNASRSALDDADMDAATESEDTQLFELFQFFERFRRQGGETEQEGAAIGIQTEMDEEARRLGAEVGLPVADVRDGTAAEVQGAAG